MKIGILVLFVNSFGQKGFYNSQEIGLAKELARRDHKVTIYKCVNTTKQARTHREVLSDGIEYRLEPVKALGNNAVSDFHFLSPDLDALVCFSDIQLCTDSVYRWAKQHQVVFIPYVGVTYSRSNSVKIRTVMNLMANRAWMVYRKTGAMAKTASVKVALEEKGVHNVTLAPVGLDFDLLQKDYHVQREALASELGLNSGLQYILLVGRIEPDRNPLDVVPVFDRLHANNQNCRLLVIGKGSQKAELFKMLEAKGLVTDTIWREQVPNSEMWKYYRIASALVNFNRTEIFGMSILEAMYYELPVFAIHAPGPDDIIVDRESGYLFWTPEAMAAELCRSFHKEIGIAEHRRVTEGFSWKTCAKAIETRVESLTTNGKLKNPVIVREVMGSYDSVVRYLKDSMNFHTVDLLTDESIQSIQSKKDGLKNGMRAVFALQRTKRSLRDAGTILAMGNYGNLYLMLMNRLHIIRPDCLIWWGFFVHSTKAQRLMKPVFRILMRENVRFILFSNCEKRLYADSIGLPVRSMLHVPYGDWSNQGMVEDAQPRKDYYFAGGYSNRNYRKLLEVWGKKIPHKLVIIGSKNNGDLVEYAQDHTNPLIEIRFDTTSEEFGQTLAGAKACIMPLRENTGASGQSVALRCMRSGKLIIADDTDVMREYVDNGNSGILLKDLQEELPEVIHKIECGELDIDQMLEQQRELFEARFSYSVITETLRHSIMELNG